MLVIELWIRLVDEFVIKKLVEFIIRIVQVFHNNPKNLFTSPPPM